jgi:hypothetical protein
MGAAHRGEFDVFVLDEVLMRAYRFVYRDTVTVGNAPATGQALIAATSLSTSVASLSCDGFVSPSFCLDVADPLR